MDADPILKEVAGQVAECTRCKLSFSRKRAVPGEGPANAQIMLIGEGPGFYENEQGRPFVGASGSFLDELLQKAGVSRKNVFITNVVKCRPPGNRDPLPEELQACNEFLDRQIAAIDPLIIVTLGRVSMAKFLNNAKISEVHGRPSWVRGRMIVPMFHPAAALHQPSLMTSVEQDFARLPEYIRQAQQDAARHTAERAAGVDSAASEQPAMAAQAGEAAHGAGQHAAKEMPVIQQPEQQSLFGSLFDAPPPAKPTVEEAPQPKDQPTQLSLF